MSENSIRAAAGRAGGGHAAEGAAAKPSTSLAVGDTSSTPSNNERANSSAEDQASTQVQAFAVGPRVLPVELLVEIFAKLSTSEVIRAAKVCRYWKEAAKSPGVWRNIAVPPVKHWTTGRSARRMLTEQDLHSLVAKSGNKVVRVNLANFASVEIEALCRCLMPSVPILRHISWSHGGAGGQELRAVCGLAKLCPHLQTLELRGPVYYNMSGTDLFCSASAVSCRPRSVSVISSGDMSWSLTSPSIFDYATTLEFTSWTMIASSLVLPSSFIAQLFQRNPNIRRLTAHGLRRNSSSPFGAIPVFFGNAAPQDAQHQPDHTDTFPALWLEYLDLRYSTVDSRLPAFDAPKLRELLIDGHHLSSFATSSLLTLDSLTLRMEEIFDHIYHQVALQGFSELAEIERARGYQGSLKLVVGSRYVESVMELLSKAFIWPGLEEVELELKEGSVRQLTGVIAARLAGARGASEEQYLFLANDAVSQLFRDHASNDARMLNPGGNREVQKFLADAASFKVDGTANPLCSQVRWKINATTSVLGTIIDWIGDLPNVQLTRK